MNNNETHVSLSHEEYKTLIDRIEHFETLNRRDADALNILHEINCILSTTENNQDRELVFSSLKDYFNRLLEFEFVAFFYADNEDSSFSLADYSKDIDLETILDLEKNVVDNGEFAWAISQNRPVLVDHTDPGKAVLLHALSTKTRVRGMFMAVMSKTHLPTSSCLNLLSTFCQSAAHLLESIDLYAMVSSTNQKLEKHNEQLESTVAERTQSLKLAVADAEHANQAKSQFLTSMSHELRTPLSSIMGFAQLLTTDPNTPPTPHQTECLEHILQGSQHLLDLINQLLDQAKIESGQLDLQIETVVLEPVLDECLSLVQALADKENISLHMPSSISYAVQVDPLRLKQVLLNLLSNGIKYNKPNGSLTIKCQEQDAIVKISVTDTGIGISQEHQEKLFTSFSRLANESSNIEGSGIGLVISKTLIEAMQGNMGFSSVEGEGTTFWFELPLTHKSSTQKIDEMTMHVSHEKLS